ncbi:MAG: hypothetical protein ABSH09_14720 [Bryobacteraceae bacterium]|jgi:urea transporter
MFAISQKLLHHIIPGVKRPLHILWNQVIGFLFIVLAVVPVPAAVRSYHDPNGLPRLTMSIVFIGLMGFFGISSFLRARRIGRS